MILFLIILTLCYCDNIEISTDSFKRIYFNQHVIDSSDLTSCNSVKISYLCNAILKVIEIQPGILLISDKAIYFYGQESLPARIDFEYKTLGLAGFVWPLVAGCVTAIILSWKLTIFIFRVSYKKHRKSSLYTDKPVFSML